MIVVQATVWPHGQQAQSYEIFSATIANQSPADTDLQNYFAHVLTRPAPFQGITGYEAHVEVTDHEYRSGFAPLLMAVLGCAHTPAIAQGVGLTLPTTRQLNRLDLIDAHQFEEMLREGVART